jgi:hypothetical protein
MLPSRFVADLATAADDIISDSLKNGGVTHKGITVAPPEDEVDALKVFLLVATHRIARAWGKILRYQYRLRMTSVFSHKTPWASFGARPPGYGHPARLPAADPMRCELADLLVVMEAPDQGRSLIERQAGLVQGKDVTKKPLSSDFNHVQHLLLSCWPSFTLSKRDRFHQRKRNLNGLAPGAATYGVINRDHGRWTIHEPKPVGQVLKCPGERFGEWLAELAAGKDGSPADRQHAGRGSSTSRISPADWPKLVDDLLHRTARREFSWTGGVATRGQTHVVRMLDWSEADPTMVRVSFSDDPLATDEIRSRPLNGGGDWGAFLSGGPAEDGPISILHIRFDPVEG